MSPAQGSTDLLCGASISGVCPTKVSPAFALCGLVLVYAYVCSLWFEDLFPVSESCKIGHEVGLFSYLPLFLFLSFLCWGLNPGPCTSEASTPTTEQNPQPPSFGFDGLK